MNVPAEIFRTYDIRGVVGRTLTAALVRDIGPTRTLTVGLTVPALGILWGWLFLGETVTSSMLAGAALVLVALVLVMRH